MTSKSSYLIIILSTIISVTVMFFYDGNDVLENVPNDKVEVRIEQNSKDIVDRTETEDKKDTVIKDDNKSKNVDPIDSRTESTNLSLHEQHIDHMEKATSNQQISKDKIVDIQDESKLDRNKMHESSNGKEKTVSVFKVSTEVIKDSLTLKDKEKLLNVALKLSRVDYEKVKGYLYSPDQEQGVIDALKLLKSRLSDRDYDKVRSVASKFVNMEAIESEDNIKDGK